MLALLRRLSHWNTQSLEGHPVQILKGIVGDADNMVQELDEIIVQATDASSETPAPYKSLLPEDR